MTLFESKELIKQAEIHIVPLGFEYHRIITPLKNYGADFVIFIDQIQSKKGEKFYNQIIDYWDKNNSQLFSNHSCKRCDMFSWWDVLRCISEIYHETDLNENKLLINLSSGSKITAMAGYHACLICEIMPYYSKIDYSKENIMDREVLKTLQIGKIHIQKPEISLIQFLSIFEKKFGHRKNNYIIKRKCAEIIMEMDSSLKKYNSQKILKSDMGRTITPYVYNVLNRKFLIPLEEWGFIKTKGSYRESIALTKEGYRNMIVYRNFYRLNY